MNIIEYERLIALYERVKHIKTMEQLTDKELAGFFFKLGCTSVNVHPFHKRTLEIMKEVEK